MSRKILITGGQGQVGLELARFAWPDETELLLPTRGDLDLAEAASLRAYVAQVRPDAIINCAAYTAVDAAEDDPDAAYAVNARAPGWLARAAQDADIPMLHVSTDYVFGTASSGVRAERDPIGPSGVYGASKLAGEIAASAACDRLVILRTAWVVSAFRANFVKTMLRLAETRDEIGVVADQRGCPTGASDIAHALAVIIQRMIVDRAAPHGIYHFVNGGEASWAELAEAVMEEAQRHDLPSARIKPIATTDFPTRAARPADSRLDIGKIGQDYAIVPRSWREMVASVVGELASLRVSQ